MFVSAIDTAAHFTRPIHTITRLWGEATVVPGAATLFFVNSDGWALTPPSPREPEDSIERGWPGDPLAIKRG